MSAIYKDQLKSKERFNLRNNVVSPPLRHDHHNTAPIWRDPQTTTGDKNI